MRAAIQLAAKLKHIFVATADGRGIPHLAAAGALSHDSENHVWVTAWFCPGTLANLKTNKQISLVVWNVSDDRGFQLVGEVEQIEDLAVLNGFAPGIEGPSHLPQVERKLRVRVDKIIGFSHAPHSDVENDSGA